MAHLHSHQTILVPVPQRRRGEAPCDIGHYCGACLAARVHAKCFVFPETPGRVMWNLVKLGFPVHPALMAGDGAGTKERWWQTLKPVERPS